MKLFSQVLISLFVCSSTITVESCLAISNSIKSNQTQIANTVNNTQVVLEVPSLAEVKLKDKTSLTGKIIKFDSKKQFIEISRNNEQRIIKLTNIQKIIFKQPMTYTPLRAKPITDEKLIRTLELTQENPQGASVELRRIHNQRKLIDRIRNSKHRIETVPAKSPTPRSSVIRDREFINILESRNNHYDNRATILGLIGNLVAVSRPYSTTWKNIPVIEFQLFESTEKASISKKFIPNINTQNKVIGFQLEQIQFETDTSMSIDVKLLYDK